VGIGYRGADEKALWHQGRSEKIQKPRWLEIFSFGGYSWKTDCLSISEPPHFPGLISGPEDSLGVSSLGVFEFRVLPVPETDFLHSFKQVTVPFRVFILSTQ